MDKDKIKKKENLSKTEKPQEEAKIAKSKKVKKC